MSEDNKIVKRPGLVWVIFIYVLCGLFGFLFSSFMMYSGKIVLPGVVVGAYFTSFTFMLTVLVILIEFIGGILLFNLRKTAFYFFIAVLIINILSNAWVIYKQDFPELYPALSLVLPWLGTVIFTSICLYIKRLEKRGVLR